MTNTQKRAAIEFSTLEKISPDAVLLEFKEPILALCEAFGNSGQSGGSALYVASVIASAVKKLLLQEPIAPVTGEEEEWMDVSQYSNGETWFQNTRCSALFKVGVDGDPHYIHAIVWKGPEEHDTFTGRVYTPDMSELISSSQYIREFPFEPEIFYVDVIYLPISKGEAEERGLHYIEHSDGSCTISVIKDMSQLEEALKYYKKKD